MVRVANISAKKCPQFEQFSGKRAVRRRGGAPRRTGRENGRRKDGSLFYRCPVILGHKSYSVSRPLSRALQQEAATPTTALYHNAVCSFLSWLHSPASFLPSLFAASFSPTETARSDKCDGRKSAARIDSIVLSAARIISTNKSIL